MPMQQFTTVQSYRSMSTRVEATKRYARAMCTVVGCGGVYSFEQVYWLQSYFLSQGFLPGIISAVERTVRSDASLPEALLVWETRGMLLHGRDGLSKSELECLVHDMLRVASVHDFPPPQVRAILSIAREVGLGREDLEVIAEAVEQEQNGAIQQGCLGSLLVAVNAEGPPRVRRVYA